jgi:SAM-dependent methyltransferase
MPTPEALRSFYAGDYTYKKAGRQSGPRALISAAEWHLFFGPKYRSRARAVRALSGMRSGRVLEVGCGSGHFLHMLRRDGWEAQGVEMSGTDVLYARDVLRLDVFRGTLDEFPSGGDPFDLVLALHVIEHLPSPRQALAKLHALLRPGGRAVIEIPVFGSLQSRIFGARWVAIAEAPRHVFVPSLQGAKFLLESSGFRDVRTLPGPVVENAAQVALSAVPTAANSIAGGRSNMVALLRRLAGGSMIAPGLLVAAAERWGTRNGSGAGAAFVAGTKV